MTIKVFKNSTFQDKRGFYWSTWKKGFLKQIKEFAKEHDINLQLCLENIPDSFHVSKINRDKDELAKQISQLLNEK